MVVDDAHQRVFVSRSSDNQVDVLGFDGKSEASIDGIPGAWGMTIADDVLYVDASASGSIDQISLEDLSIVNQLAAGLNGSRGLAYAHGELWTVTVDSASLLNRLTSVSLSGTVSSYGDLSDLGDLPVASSAHPDGLWVEGGGVSPTSIYRFDLSTGSPVQTASDSNSGWSGDVGAANLVVTPDGGAIIGAPSAPNYNVGELNSTTLSPDGVVYPDQPYPSQVAVSPALGGLVAVTARDGLSEPGIRIFHVGVPEVQLGIATSTDNPDVMANNLGLAMSADGRFVFAVQDDLDPKCGIYPYAGCTEGQVLSFHVYPTLAFTSVTLTVTPGIDLSAVSTNQEVQLSATVASPYGSFGAVTGTMIFSDDGTVIASVPVTSGVASIPLSWASAGVHLLAATYSGDSDNATSEATVPVTVVGAVTTTTATTGGSSPPTPLTSSAASTTVVSAAPTTVPVPGGGTVPAPPSTAPSATSPSCPSGISHQASGQVAALAATVQVINHRSCPGYWIAAKNGGVTAVGSAPWLGDMAQRQLSAPIVGVVATPDQRGYYLLGSDGGIFTYGDARFYGSTGGIALNAPVVAMAVSPSGGGYWILASDGGVFSYGTARFQGSTGAIHLDAPMVGISVDSVTGGYWLAAADGGVFAYHAPFYGSMGQAKLASPIVGMSPQPDNAGYRMVGSDGGVFDFGSARYYGSLPSEHLATTSIISLAPTVDGAGYYLMNTQGNIWGLLAFQRGVMFGRRFQLGLPA